MSDITLIANDYAILIYHEDKKVMHHIFHKPIGGEDFRAVLVTGVEYLKQYGATKWLSDDRLNSALPAEDSRWATQVWAPMVLEAGWKTWALVVPQDILGRMNMIEFVTLHSKNGVRVMVFTDPDAAMAWLDGIEN